jgi:hypothetical protein
LPADLTQVNSQEIDDKGKKPTFLISQPSMSGLLKNFSYLASNSASVSVECLDMNLTEPTGKRCHFLDCKCEFAGKINACRSGFLLTSGRADGCLENAIADGRIEPTGDGSQHLGICRKLSCGEKWLPEKRGEPDRKLYSRVKLCMKIMSFDINITFLTLFTANNQ